MAFNDEKNKERLRESRKKGVHDKPESINISIEQNDYEPRKRYTFTITPTEREALSLITKTLKIKSDSQTLSKFINDTFKSLGLDDKQ